MFSQGLKGRSLADPVSVPRWKGRAETKQEVYYKYTWSIYLFIYF